MLTAMAGGRPPRTSPSPPVLLHGPTSAPTKIKFIPHPHLMTGTVARLLDSLASSGPRSGSSPLQLVLKIQGPQSTVSELSCGFWGNTLGGYSFGFITIRSWRAEVKAPWHESRSSHRCHPVCEKEKKNRINSSIISPYGTNTKPTSSF